MNNMITNIWGKVRPVVLYLIIPTHAFLVFMYIVTFTILDRDFPLTLFNTETLNEKVFLAVQGYSYHFNYILHPLVVLVMPFVLVFRDITMRIHFERSNGVMTEELNLLTFQPFFVPLLSVPLCMFYWYIISWLLG